MPGSPLVVSLGDPAGVGPEMVARAWEARVDHQLPPFFAVGDAASVSAVWGGPMRVVDSVDAALAAFNEAFPVLHVLDSGQLTPGEPTLDGAHCALRALELGIGLARSEQVAGLITAPVSKVQLAQVGFTHPGQTEFIAERCGVERQQAVMMLAGPSLRVIPITVHVPLRHAIDMLTVDLIVSRTTFAARGLCRSLGITSPRLAMAGLNPHAGEAGQMGDEEQRILLPALEQLRAQGLDVSGPHSPDAMFTPAARASYDAAICLYHDQGLIPLKALHFDEGVNATLGLPIVRTSPDHGTAFGLAGTGQASPGATISAIRMAAEMVVQRRN